jgi:hypothetical protein
LGAVFIGLGNPDHHGRKGALAEIPVTVGPFHSKAFVRVDGYVSLPDELRDEDLRVEIAIEAHEVVLGALGARWHRQQERMREYAAHLASQWAGGQGNG